MKNITKSAGFAIITCVLVTALFSCNNNKPIYDPGRCADSLAKAAAAKAQVADTAAAGNAGANTNSAGSASMERNSMATGSARNAMGEDENEGIGALHVTSSAFENNGVIPARYTCEGEGFSPPLSITNIPPGAKSLTAIVYDYHAGPEGGITYWIIWNLDPSGNIPEKFTNDHEAVNDAHNYGYNPICAKSGNHKYHFIVYALDCELKMGKNTTKPMIEKVMSGHVLAKGVLVGIYNKRLD